MSEPLPNETEFRMLCSLMENIEGEANAWTLFQIGDHLKIERRKLEHLFETRLRDFPFPICSTDKGYFRPRSADECNKSIHYKRTRFSKLQARIEAEEFLGRRAGIKFENGRFVDAPKQAEFGLN